MSDEIDDDLSERDDLKEGVNLYEHLLIAADGGGRVMRDQYYASTVLALIDNAEYRKTVLEQHEADYSAASTSSAD